MKGIISMKTYVNPMLQIVSIEKNDIVTASYLNIDGTAVAGTYGDAPDRFRDFEDYSY